MVFILDNFRRDFRRNRANKKDRNLNRESINTVDNQYVRVDDRNFDRISNTNFRWGFRRRFRRENDAINYLDINLAYCPGFRKIFF